MTKYSSDLYKQVLLHLLSFSFLTVLTQVGGLVYLLSLMVQRWMKRKGFHRAWVFPILYACVWWCLPWMAAPWGRVPLPLRADAASPLQPQHWLTVACNRHYVLPELREEAIRVARGFAERHDGAALTYLDANFPFWDGFPLLPHLSHHDGRKLDFAFAYQSEAGLTTRAPAFLGYGRCASPRPHERDQAAICHAAGYAQYSFLRPLARPFLTRRYTLDEAATTDMVNAFAQRPRIEKLFLEPHLKTRWRLQDPKIRFHGCRAVRHDDHLHVQWR